MDLLANAGAAAEPLTVSSAPSPARGGSTGKRTRGGAAPGGSASKGAGGGTAESKSGGGSANQNGGSESGSVQKVNAVAMNLAEVTAVAALVEHGSGGRSGSEKRERKRARQLDFGGGGGPSSDPSSARGGEAESEDGHMSPSAAAGTLLGFSQSSQWFTESPGTPGKRKPCNCKNSKCLKLYCECFASGTYCNTSCNCQSCHNNEVHHEERQNAVEATLERNPQAFRPKIANNNISAGDEESPLHGRHTKGCHCKKSGCLKKYCECFQAGVMCSAVCKCHECKNTEESSERRALLSGTGEMNFAGTPQHRGGGSASPSPSIIKREPNSGNLVSPQHGGAGASARGAPGSLGDGRLGGASDAATARDGYASALSMLGGMMHPDMLVRGDGSGPTTALQIQQAMLGMQVAQGSRSQLASLPLMGVGAADAINVAERCVLRKHLSDPVLFNLCRVLVLSAMQAGGGDEGSGEAAVLKELADFTSRLCEIAKAKGADRETKDGQVGAADKGQAEEGAASERDSAEGAAAPKDEPAKEES